MRRALALAFLIVASPALAQQTFEVAPFIGYTSAAPIDATADGVDELAIDDALTLGARAAYLVTPNLGLELAWSFQWTSLSLTSASSTARLFDMTSNHVHANMLYQFGDAAARWRPFVFGGVGTAIYESEGLNTEAKLSWDVGGGVQWFPRQAFGIEGRARLMPTLTGGSSGDEFCAPFSFCQGSVTQFNILVGGVFRF
jgi:hypothetical protein